MEERYRAGITLYAKYITNYDTKSNCNSFAQNIHVRYLDGINYCPRFTSLEKEI